MAGPSTEPVSNKKNITEMDKQELCAFISALCRKVVAEVGSRGRRGGIYPDNIRVDEAGAISLGPAGKSPWQGQELQFTAPEQYWDGQLSAASDVYAVGLVMYYAVSGGRLPLEGECEDPLQRRMEGVNPSAPADAGIRLGSIIEKSLRFKASERYQTLEELRAVVESCVKDLYLGGVPSAVAIFSKSEDELDDVERLMVGIIDQDEDGPAEKLPAAPEEADASEDGVKVYQPAVKAGQKDVISSAQSDILAKKMKETASPAVPKLDREESDPILQPVTLSRSAARSSPAVQYKLKTDREKEIAEEVKKRRRRPIAIILVLCAILVIVAIIMEAMSRDLAEYLRDLSGTAAPTETAAETDPYAATATPEQIRIEDFGGALSGPSVTMDVILPEIDIEEIPAEHSYQVIRENIGWSMASAACQRLGGHLVVINDEVEFNEVVRLAEEAELTYVWIGAHRANGTERWENGLDFDKGFVRWSRGEPTYQDRNDQVAEDFIMLWNNGGTWAYNDNRDDPYADYPNMFEGKIGYICEFNDN